MTKTSRTIIAAVMVALTVTMLVVTVVLIQAGAYLGAIPTALLAVVCTLGAVRDFRLLAKGK